MPDPTKSRPFSVHLLKTGYDASNALSGDHKLGDPVTASNLPIASVLHVFDGKPREPWWRLYLGISGKLEQATKAALLFVEVDGRTFAICFGNTAHNLENESYEYDFGLKVTLNCVDPDKLKNTDVAEPGAARRQRTQTSVGSDLTYFDFESDSKVLRSLTGVVKPEFADLLKNVTGSSNVRFTSRTRVGEIPTLCKKLFELYQLEDYKTSFPDVQNISPVRDPATIQELDASLVEALRGRSDVPLLAVPELLDYNDYSSARFTGEGASLLYPDLYLDLYYQHLESRGFDLSKLDRDKLAHDKLELLTEDEQRRGIYPIYRCLVYDSNVAGDSGIFHLMEGSWYRFEADYVKRVTESLEPLLATTSLPPCTAHEEKDYNLAAAAAVANGVCLDRTSFSPTGSRQVEPCDVLYEDSGTAAFAHVKISTTGSELSHLFNQGANSIELLRSNDEAREKLRKLIDVKAASPSVARVIQALVDVDKTRVDYVIITHKPAAGGVNNLPLFSRIGLSRAARSLRAMRVEVRLSFVANDAPDRPGKQRARKKRA